MGDAQVGYDNSSNAGIADNSGTMLGHPIPESGGNSSENVMSLVARLKEAMGGGGLPSVAGLTTMGSGQNPGSMPPHPTQAPMEYPHPTGGYGSSGERKTAQRQALVHGVAQTVNQYATYVAQKRDRVMQLTMERVFDAQQGLSESQSMLAEAQKSGDQGKIGEAQKVVGKNMEILSHIFDPTTSEGKKNIKMYEKVHAVNILGESKEKNSPEYKNYIKTLSKWIQEGKQPSQNPVVANIDKQTPSRMQMAPGYNILKEAIKDKVIPGAESTQTQEHEDFRQSLKSGTSEEIANKIMKEKDRNTQARMLMQVRDEKSKKEYEEVVGNWHLAVAKERSKNMLDVQDKITERWKALKIADKKDYAGVRLEYEASSALMEKLTAKIEKASPNWFGFGGDPAAVAELTGLMTAATKLQASLMNKMTRINLGIQGNMAPNMGAPGDPANASPTPTPTTPTPDPDAPENNPGSGEVNENTGSTPDDIQSLDEMYKQALNQ